MIVERHEGEISFSAANPRGAIFRVVLPQSRFNSLSSMPEAGPQCEVGM